MNILIPRQKDTLQVINFSSYVQFFQCILFLREWNMISYTKMTIFFHCKQLFWRMYVIKFHLEIDHGQEEIAYYKCAEMQCNQHFSTWLLPRKHYTLENVDNKLFQE